LGFILALLGLAIFAAFLRDSFGVPFGMALSIIWVYVAVVAFAAGIGYFAQLVAPMRSRQGWWEGVRLIMRAYTGIVQQYMSQPRTSDKKKRQPTSAVVPPVNIPRSLYTLRAGLLRSYHVLPITKGNSYVRAAGPGFIDLYEKETFQTVIDLRTQLRQQPLHFITRDGIPIEAMVTVIFQVKQDRDANPHLLFPYDQKAIFHLSYLNTVDKEGKMLGWADQLTPRAAALYAEELAQFNLDALIHFTTISPIEEMSRRILSLLKGDFEGKGINVIAASVGSVKPPEDVKKQNIITWQAEWKRKIEVEEATRKAEEIRRKKQARARGQVEIIQSIIQNLETMRQDKESDMYQVVILRLIDALEEAVTADSPRTAIPQQIMAGLLAETSAQVRSRLEDPLLPSGQVDDDGGRP
jgi:regulator of protease activity HflC (stomatin/prohibitin superfamily)